MSRTAALVLGLAMIVVGMPGTTLAQDDGQPAGDTDTVTFYGHVFGHGLGAPMPANTEYPVGETIYGIGTGAECSSTLPDAIAVDCENVPWNKLALFSTAGFVDVQSRSQFLQQGDYAQLHNERGQSKDVLLDTSGQVSATLYGAWDAHGWAVSAVNPDGTNCLYPHAPGIPCLYPYWGWDPGVHEDVVMEATLYHADLGDRSNASQAPPIEEAVTGGEAAVIAEERWGPDQVINGLPGYPNAFQWDIDMGAPQVDTIPRDHDFFLVFETYQETAGENRCVDCPMRWWSGEFFPPSFEVPIENAFTVERTIPNFANGKLAMLGIINSPWGSYDVDQDSVELEIDGPRGASVSSDHIEQYSDFSTAHGGHYDPVNVTWIWDYRADDAPAGEYEVTVSAQNFQNSASSECTATFTLTQEGDAVLPGETEDGICGTQSETVEEKVEETREGVDEQTEGE